MSDYDPVDDALHRTFQEVERRLADPKRLVSVRGTLEKPVPELVHVLIRALAAELDCDFAAVTVVDQTHQHFLSTNMGAVPACEIGSSKCQWVISTGDMVAINNVDESGFWKRLVRTILPDGRPMAAYLGVPLTDIDGEVLGAVCVVNARPRVWTAQEHYALYETSQHIRNVLIEAANES